jgi:hypothetical protein
LCSPIALPTGLSFEVLRGFGQHVNINSGDFSVARRYIEDGMLVLRSNQIGPANWTTGAVGDEIECTRVSSLFKYPVSVEEDSRRTVKELTKC